MPLWKVEERVIPTQRGLAEDKLNGFGFNPLLKAYLRLLSCSLHAFRIGFHNSDLGLDLNGVCVRVGGDCQWWTTIFIVLSGSGDFLLPVSILSLWAEYLRDQ